MGWTTYLPIWGLSPRVRGNLFDCCQPRQPVGSIPASAGEPPSRCPPGRGLWVYPRECGGTVAVYPRPVSARGLSPRVRGNPRRCGRGCAFRRSIPASAGEPRVAGLVTHIVEVYPRECGGTFRREAVRRLHSGLSPRVRGNRSPAAASSRTGVYPRECGGTVNRAGMREGSLGLSPRVRGNHRGRFRELRRGGSIPASAGEPYASKSSCLSAKVYPRECGGTLPPAAPVSSSMGLSPRVRGNPRRAVREGRRVRSIPASAGEPRLRGSRREGFQVYPRECGGTLIAPRRNVTAKGLSPRVRGNLLRRRRRQPHGGSIPASAGEPPTPCAGKATSRVYPRECGGTRRRRAGREGFEGLSPRVRGNLSPTAATRPPRGSIPASAGEPGRISTPSAASRVYPRECGGTGEDRRRLDRVVGLSPRVRGNP